MTTAISAPSTPGKTIPATVVACAYSEYGQFRLWASQAERAGRHSDARHYRYLANDALAQLKRTEEETR